MESAGEGRPWVGGFQVGGWHGEIQWDAFGIVL